MKVKKMIAVVMVATMLMLGAGQVAQAAEGRGGFMGFIAGCCFGMRAGAAFNDGKDIHWREWCMLIPFANYVFSIWNGVDGASGVTTADYADQYGSMYF